LIKVFEGLFGREESFKGKIEETLGKLKSDEIYNNMLIIKIFE